jgi:peptidyl-prolyl cis-trans isomerase C
MKQFLLTITFILTAVAAFAETRPQDVAAVVNGEVITVKRLNELYLKLSPQMRENYNRSGGKRAFLENYIERRLLVQEALKQNLDKRADVQADIQAARDSILFDRYVRDSIAATIVAEADVRSFYENNKQQFLKTPKVKARHILVSPVAGQVMNETNNDAGDEKAAIAKIHRIQAQIKTGEVTFEQAARMFSEDAAAPQGGDLGWVSPGQMVGPFESAAFALEKGQISDVVKTDFGYHLIRVDEKQVADYAPFVEVANEIRERLLAERTSDIMAEVAKMTRELRQTSQVTINEVNIE